VKGGRERARSKQREAKERTYLVEGTDLLSTSVGLEVLENHFVDDESLLRALRFGSWRRRRRVRSVGLGGRRSSWC